MLLELPIGTPCERRLSHRLATVRAVYEFEATCEACGHSWRFLADEEPDFAECIGCGADAFAIILIGTRFEP